MSRDSDNLKYSLFAFSETARAQVIGATAFAYSPIFNPRRTEDTTYAIWAAIFTLLAESIKPVFIAKDQPPPLLTPQLGIYFSLKSDAAALAGPDSSTRTQADVQGKRNGIFTDFAIVSLGIKNSVYSYLPYRGVQVTRSDTYVLLLSELKPPPTRNPETIADYYFSISQGTEAALTQADKQGHLLMCVLRYAQQEFTIELAGAGDWFQARLYTRADAKMAGPLELAHHEGYVNVLESDSDFNVGDELGEPDEIGKLRIVDDVTPIREDLDIERANIERLRRLQRRNAVKDRQQNRAQIRQDLKELRTETQFPYSREALNMYNKLYWAEKGKDKEEDWVALDDDEPKLTTSWSKLYVLGTKAADDMLARINQALQELDFSVKVDA
ncbi:hypothetical protein EV360DRAFT_89152 [Lentinula raphanica]|nr:hypothetical protein EV360DRAFT_89152 [Lentinula raphanica]